MNTSRREQPWRNKPAKGQKVDVSTFGYGKIPPQDKEMEEAVLGACMLQKNAFDSIAEILREECFYVEAHKTIFSCMLKMSAKCQPIDMLTVVNQLKTEGVLEITGGVYFVSTLTNKVVSAANIEAHARIILQKYIQRELIRIGGEIVNEAFEGTTDVFDSLDKAEAQLFTIATGHLKKDFRAMRPEYNKVIEIIQERMISKQDITGVPSGFPSLDRVTHGWQDTDLIILAARPSVGKTAFALNLARNAVKNDIRSVNAGLFMLEMGTGQVIFRMIAAESETKLDDLIRGKIDDYQLIEVQSKCEVGTLLDHVFIDDTPALSLFELRAKARRMVHNHNVGLIVIDYLQLMTASVDGRSGNREQEISKISRDLKALAKELHIPIIALSQLSRDVEKRSANKGAQLSDLRESGAIEQDADMVMFLSRPDYQQEATEVDPSLRGKVDLKIAKHRNGDLATIPLDADLSIQKFTDPNRLIDANRTMKFIGARAAEQRYQIENPPPPPVEEDDDLPF